MKPYLFALLSVFILAACSDDDIDPNKDYVGLGGYDYVDNEIDEWLYEYYVKPYNIQVNYRWDRWQLDELNYTLIPIKEELVIPAMETLYKTWIMPFVTLAGEEFIQELSPKTYILIGSPKYKADGTYTTGEAEGGRKVILYRMNWFDQSDSDIVTRILRTTLHEFGHIMHQTVMYPYEFEQITPWGYTTSWNNYSETEALELGFISSYARNNANDDFVDLLSYYLSYGQEWYDQKLADAEQLWIDSNETLPVDPADAIRQKVAIMVTYLDDVWGINFYDEYVAVDGQNVLKKGLLTLVQEAIEEVIHGS